MLNPKTGHRRRLADWPYWAADNGCFSNAWDADHWWAWLQRLPTTGCLFAVAPDVVGDHAATMQLAHWLPRIRSLGFPAAFVAQDGSSPDTIPWDDLDWLFIGGTTQFKETCWALTDEAARRGIPVHMGRVNSRRRLRIAHAMGCATTDGTLTAFGPDVHVPRIGRWLDECRTTQTLWTLTEPVG